MNISINKCYEIFYHYNLGIQSDKTVISEYLNIMDKKTPLKNQHITEDNLADDNTTPLSQDLASLRKKPWSE